MRMASRSCAASSKRSASAAVSMRLLSVLISSSFLPSRNSCVSLTAPLYSAGEHTLSTQGARHRLMSYSKQGRSRLPVMTSLHERMPNSLCVSDMVFRAKCAGRKGPA